MKKIIILALSITLLFLLQQGVRADLIVSTNQTIVTGFVGQTIELPFLFRNNNTFTIYNISLEQNNYTSMERIPELSPNQEITQNINVSSQQQINQTITLTFYYYYKQNITLQPQTYQVTEWEDNFNPDSLTISNTSTIEFTNNDTIIHSVTDTDSEFDFTLQPSETRTYQFMNVKDYTIYDKYSIATLVLIVKPSTEERLVHNSNYDKNYNIHLIFNYEYTDIEAELSENNITTNYNESKETILHIKNTGNINVLNISLKGDWLSFHENNFNIEPNDDKYIIVTIKPIINSTEQTNKTHTINISIKGNNINETKIPLNIFIPYKEIKKPSQEEIKCKDYFDKRNVSLHYTIKELQDWLSLYSQEITDITKMNNLYKEQTENSNEIKNRVSNIEKNISSIQQQLEDDRKQNKIFAIIITLIIVLSVISFVGYYLYQKKLYNEYNQI